MIISGLNILFSGGVGRSGTTIVGRILRQHSEVFAGSPNEIKFITETNGLIDLTFGLRDFLPSQTSLKGRVYGKMPLQKSRQFRFQSFRNRVLGDWWNRTNRLGVQSGLHRSMPKAKMEELLKQLKSDLDNPVEAARSFIHGYVANHMKYRGESVWMDTTPANIMYSDLIYQILPDAKFIEMKRSPLDNISSVLKEPWGPNELEKVIPWFMDRVSLANRAKANIPDKSMITFFLEDLVRDSRETEYERLRNFVNLSHEPKMRKYFDQEVNPERAHFGRWREDFSDPESVRRMFADFANKRSFAESY